MNSITIIPTYNEKDNIQLLPEETFKLALDIGFSINEIPIVFYAREFGISKKSKSIVLDALFKTRLFRLF